MRLQAILLPLDGTAHSLAALPVASMLASSAGTTVHVLHVGGPTSAPQDLAYGLGLEPETLRGSVVEQAAGSPAAAILDWTRKQPGSVVVMCTHTGVDKPRGSLGSVAVEVLCKAACPIVLVQPERGSRAWEIRRILLPHDGTPTTAAAMDPAGELAHRTSAEVLVLHVAGSATEQPTERGTLAAPRYVDQPQHEWPTWGAEFLDRMTALGHPPAKVKFRLSMAVGEPGEQIVRFAREHDVDLVFLAWHGRWEGKRAATMKRVIRDSGCPVFVVRTADRLGGEERM